MIKAGPETNRAPGWWYPYIYVAMFGVVILVNGILVVLAVGGFGGLDSEHAFEEGLAYNDRIEASETQARLGWQAVLTETPTTAGSPSRLGLTVTDRSGQPVRGLAVTAEVRRLSDARLDQHLGLTAESDGTYAAPVTLTVPGQWELRLTATRDETVYRLRRRIVVDAP